MEVYEDPETLSFVHEGNAVTIPFLDYHPVFSQEELEFIWCIAGDRYWILNGGADATTT